MKRRLIKLAIFSIFTMNIFSNVYSMGSTNKPKPTPQPQPEEPSNPGGYKFGKRIGYNPSGVTENSGMVYSKTYERMYMINDSGNGNYFFVTDMKGNLIEKVKINNAKNVDFEGLSYAPCDQDKCIYIGDIGDNSEDNSTHHVYIIKELNTFNKSASLKTDITFTYEKGLTPNAESLAVHPITGDIYIATKNYSGHSTFLYKISKSVFSGKSNVSTVAKLVGEVSYTTLESSTKIDYTHTTDMAFSPSGEKFLLLTDQSRTVWEFSVDLSKFNYLNVNDVYDHYKVIPVDYLGQEESLTYYNENEFIYTTEGDSAPILQVKINK
ncbi:MAG: hypothetical protein U0T83_04845 [Bacteriovoracaceae bacterium]